MPPQWNGRYAGARAFTAVRYGYHVGGIDNRMFLAHRVLWAVVHGAWPEGQIDHIDGDGTNNRLSNLRVVSNTENARNAKLSKRNSSGRAGVGLHKASGRWEARIGVGKRKRHLGLFTRFDDACAARAAAEIEYGFHENHGR